jgi:ubiquinone/menaquinone biosynthesis C-methylase UbiE
LTEFKKRKEFDKIAPLRSRFIQRNHFYYSDLTKFYRLHIPEGKRVLELGCGSGDLLVALRPSFGVGIDFCEFLIWQAKDRHPECRFIVADIEDLPLLGLFDYIIMSDILESLDDVQSALINLLPCCHSRTRIICNFFNHLWEPILKFGEKIKLKTPNPVSNWLSINDVENLFYLARFEVVSSGYRMLFPRNIPIVSYLINYVVGILPFFRKLCLTQTLVVRPQPAPVSDWKERYSVSIVIPTRDEAGNIPGCFTRTPKLGKWTELIFVDGNSTDGTVEAIEKGIAEHGKEWSRVILIHQGEGRGKGDAIRKGFVKARGDILMILDSDLTMPPENLPKFYDAIATNKGEFINGCRLVYPVEEESMRPINLIGNKAFSVIFSWLLPMAERL